MLSILAIIFGTFCVHDYINDQDFTYLLVTLRKKVNRKLFLVVFCYIIIFRFEAKYKPGLKLNLDMDTDPKLSMPVRFAHL
jgi:3-deoxy-D-arabino-heptulosonate 7-phosphate (DAHP) synthase